MTSICWTHHSESVLINAFYVNARLWILIPSRAEAWIVEELAKWSTTETMGLQGNMSFCSPVVSAWWFMQLWREAACLRPVFGESDRWRWKICSAVAWRRNCCWKPNLQKYSCHHAVELFPTGNKVHFWRNW